MPVTVSSAAAARADVLHLASEIERTDGAPPLSDQTVADIGADSVQEFTALDDDGALVGYAQLAGGSLEIAARADAVDALLDAAIGANDDALLVWSHGKSSRVVPALEARDFERERELHQLRRPLDDLPADPALAEGVTVRTFVPGRDDEAWMQLNAAAFVHHPEQGRMTEADLQARMAESWFDAEGFLLAERGDELIGFHWTKVHPHGIGEVYVLGVAPSGQGLGLGGALLIRGLHDLADRRRCTQVLLYVDGDNPTALHLYERDGFTRYDLDVQWRRPKAV